MPELLYPAAVVLAAYVVLGITGFGSALVIVPLLAWHWPLPEVVALTLLLDVPASLLHGGLNLRQVNRTELRRLLPGLVAGVLLGNHLARCVSPSALRRVICGLLVVSGLCLVGQALGV